jgi:hypothetical protein
MSKPAAQCWDCDHHREVFEPVVTLICAKGHKPRFYLPRDMMDADWGWKRQCEEFKSRFPDDKRNY